MSRGTVLVLVLASAAICRADGPDGGAASCDAATPRAACEALEGLSATGRLAPCTPDAPTRSGEWRYALIAPLYSPVEDVSAAELRALWAGASKTRVTLRASAQTRAALSTVLGQGRVGELGARPEVDAAHWAVVPADELLPYWSVVTVDGRHPLGAEASPLTVGLCGVAGAEVRNLDPAQLTTVAMTGTTALTRGTANLLDAKGPAYAARDVAPWFRGTDFVHISNEVSFLPKGQCTQKDAHTKLLFCSNEENIATLEAVHANIIELTGNHLQDFGKDQLSHTLDLYQQRGWRWFGGGRDQYQATRPLTLEHHGNKLAFLGCNMESTVLKLATPGPGSAICDLKRMDWQIGELRRQGYLPIATIQHDEVYSHDPPGTVVRDLRRLAEDGAAFVEGSQAHSAHPWELHHGAYVHYGPGNLFFDQEAPVTRDAVSDRLYVYRNRLLTVGHLYTRMEEFGRPRPLSAAERTALLGALTASLGKLKKAEPWAAPRDPPPQRTRPDSFLVTKDSYELTVTAPEGVDVEGTKEKYPLVIACDGEPPEAPKAFVVVPAFACTAPLVEALTDFMATKYPVDPKQVSATRGGAPSSQAPGSR